MRGNRFFKGLLAIHDCYKRSVINHAWGGDVKDTRRDVKTRSPKKFGRLPPSRAKDLFFPTDRQPGSSIWGAEEERQEKKTYREETGGGGANLQEKPFEVSNALGWVFGGEIKTHGFL